MNDLIDTTEMYLRTIFELRRRASSRCVPGSPSGSPRAAPPSARPWPGWSATACSPSRATGTCSSDHGRPLATGVMRKHRLAECLLVDVIGLD